MHGSNHFDAVAPETSLRVIRFLSKWFALGYLAGFGANLLAGDFQAWRLLDFLFGAYLGFEFWSGSPYQVESEVLNRD